MPGWRQARDAVDRVRFAEGFRGVRGATRETGVSNGNSHSPDRLRRLQRSRLETLLAAWLPVASDPAEAQAEKAVGLALKIMERQAALDGLDLKGGKPGEELEAVHFADPQELAERIKTVSPILMARLRGDKQSIFE